MLQQTVRRERNPIYRPFPGDDVLVVSFFNDDRKNEALTLERGYAVYEDVPHIKIQIPGNKEATVVAPANSECVMPDGTVLPYSERFPEDYERWQHGQGAALVGLPLKQAPFLSKAEVSMLAGQNVFTVEQLADLGGRPLKALGASGRKWQQQAVAFLRTASDNRDAMADAADVAALKQRIEELEATLTAATKPEAEDTAAEDDDAEREELKAKYAELTGARPRGQPKIERLREMVAEAQA